MKKYLLIAAFLSFSLAYAQNNYPTPSLDAQDVLTTIDQSNCNETAGGFYCYILVNSKLVSVIIPRNFAKSEKCLLHFHGLRERDPEDLTPASTIQYFNFAESLQAQSPTTLMIAPIGAFGADNYDLPDNYGSLPQVETVLAGVSVRTGMSCTSLILSGHSMAYAVLTPVVDDINNNPNDRTSQMVANIFLFDALYSSDVQPFTDWVANSSSHTIYNVARGTSSTWTNSQLIPASPRYLDFLSTIADHWELVRDKYFALFLQLPSNTDDN